MFIIAGYLREVNIKSDLPTVNDAIRRVTYNIRNGKILGASAIKFVHGYGSSGKGGKIRPAVRKYLDTQKKHHLIRDYITGEQFSLFDSATLDAFRCCDDLRRDSDLDRHNNGITIVIL